MANPLHAWRGLRALPRPVWVSVIAALVNRLGTMALPFLALFLTRERQLDATRAGLYLSLYGCIALVAGPLSGRLCDRFGPVKVMRLSFLATGLVVMGVPLAPTGLPLAGVIIAWAFANETFRPANLAHLGSVVEAGQRKQAFAFNRWAVNLGMSVGPAVGGLVAAHSFAWVFIIDGATSLLSAAVIFLAMPELPAPEQHASAPSRGFGLGALADPKLLTALLGLLPLSALFFQIDSTLSLFTVQHLKLSPAVFGLLATVNTLLIVAVEIPLNHATSAWSHRRTMVLGALLTGFGFALIGLANGFGMLVATTVIWTFGEMITSPGISSYVADIAPASRRGEYMGLFTMTWSVAFIVAPWAGTQLLAHVGPRLVWPILGGLGVLSALGYARLPGRTEHPAADAA